MGLAASQARFLQCTARRTNVEYQGQQINNARTVLANKSANAYNEMLTLQVPTPPSQADYTTVKYGFSMNGTKYYLTKKEYENLYETLNNDVKAYANAGNTDNCTYLRTDYVDNSEYRSGTYLTSANGQKINIGGTEFNFALRFSAGNDSSTYAPSLNTNTGMISSIWLSTTDDFDTSSDTVGKDFNNGCITFSTEEVVDQAGYDDAYNQYKYEQYMYEQEVQNINAKTSIILQQDKVLELQLKQLDTEQTALKTELDALDKVIGDHVDSEFKTFGG